MSAAVEQAGARAADAILRYVGHAAVAIVVERNAGEENPHVCHSHDVCDANAFMGVALQAAGVDDQEPNWSEAWAAMQARLGELVEAWRSDRQTMV